MIDNKFALVPNTGMYSEGTLILPQHQLYRWQRQNGECEFVLLADSPLVIIGLSLGTLLLHSCMRHTPKSSSAESRQKIFCICLSSFMITLLAIYLLGTCGNTWDKRDNKCRTLHAKIWVFYLIFAHFSIFEKTLTELEPVDWLYELYCNQFYTYRCTTPQKNLPVQTASLSLLMWGWAGESSTQRRNYHLLFANLKNLSLNNRSPTHHGARRRIIWLANFTLLLMVLIINSPSIPVPPDCDSNTSATGEENATPSHPISLRSANSSVELHNNNKARHKVSNTVPGCA